MKLLCKSAVSATYDAIVHIDVLAQDCNNSIANALELLQSCTKPPVWLAASVCNTVIKKIKASVKVVTTSLYHDQS